MSLRRTVKKTASNGAVNTLPLCEQCGRRYSHYDARYVVEKFGVRATICPTCALCSTPENEQRIAQEK